MGIKLKLSRETQKVPDKKEHKSDLFEEALIAFAASIVEQVRTTDSAIKVALIIASSAIMFSNIITVVIVALALRH